MISVIIPSYNHGRYLPQRIESVLKQTFTDFECIILDDASTDDSVSIIERFVAEDKRITEWH
jgi:glycosyltransferase involved in cell wall biosynthesis